MGAGNLRPWALGFIVALFGCNLSSQDLKFVKVFDFCVCVPHHHHHQEVEETLRGKTFEVTNEIHTHMWLNQRECFVWESAGILRSTYC